MNSILDVVECDSKGPVSTVISYMYVSLGLLSFKYGHSN